MASSKEYLQFILEQLSDLEEINYRAMMGEYIIYYRGRIAGSSAKSRQSKSNTYDYSIKHGEYKIKNKSDVKTQRCFL